jgi:uncharacterized protein (DUF362 family)
MVHPVALRRCPSYDAADLDPALDALLADLGGLARFVKAGQTVILKPNLIADCPPERCATTHPAVIAALARRVQALGATPVIADAPAWGGPKTVARVTGMTAVCEELGIEFVNFDQKTRLASVRPEIATHFHVDPRLLAADVVINCGKFKAHQQLGFTNCLKNLYGAIAGREKAWHHLARSRTDMVFARFIAALAYSVPVKLHVSDAVGVMEGAGPRLGTAWHWGVLAASAGGSEIDAVLADLVGVPASHRLVLDAVAELGLGETDPARIDTVGEEREGLRASGFLWPHLVGVAFSPPRLVRGWWRNRRMVRAEE